MPFKIGDQVRMKSDVTLYGEVTGLKKDEKTGTVFYTVNFPDGDAPDWWLYPEQSLELLKVN